MRLLENQGMTSSKTVIFDTNLWISYLISRRIRFIDNLIEKGIIRLVFSDESIEEFISVSQRPKFQKHFSMNDVKELLRIFDAYGKLVKVSTNVSKCRDFKDNFLLNLALDSNADFLVTGDSDLLELKKIGDTEIVTIKDLVKALK